jgi:hypothetical protein
MLSERETVVDHMHHSPCSCIMQAPWLRRRVFSLARLQVVEKLKPEQLTEEQKEYASYRKQKRNEKRALRGQGPEDGEEAEVSRTTEFGAPCRSPCLNPY